MITRFERRGIALLLTMIMCISMVCSGSMVAYAEDGTQAEAAEGTTEETEKSAGEQGAEEVTSEGGDDQTGEEAETETISEIEKASSPEETKDSNEVTEEEKDAEAKAAGSFEDYDYQVLADGTVEITKYHGAGGAVVVPDTIEGKNVSSIGREAFVSNDSVTQVNLPATVTELQYASFGACRNLAKVILPENSQLKTIGGYAFFRSGLTEMDCPSVQEIKELAFRECEQLISVTLGNKLTFLGVAAFAHSGIQKINIPESLTGIEEFVFYGCKDLREIALPNSIVSIGEYAFASSGLNNIDLPDSVTSIGDRAFERCENLNTANIGNKLAYISNYAFADCDLTTIKIGNQVEKIGNYAFNGNERLAEVELPKNVTALEYAAFRYCKSLGRISFPDSLEKIGGIALDNTAWYAARNDGVVYAGKVLYRYKGNMPADTVVDVKDGTKGIAAFAFDGYQNLKEINIPNRVTNIGEFAFYDCGAMTSVVIPASVTEIGQMALGYRASENGTRFEDESEFYNVSGYCEKIPDFMIYGVEGSAAQTYAQGNGFEFTALKALKIVPEVTDNTYIIGSSEGVTITCTGELKDFVSVFMDDQEVDKSNYTLAEGSTILTFATKYLNTLSVGKHKVTMNYTYGSVDTELNVLDSNEEQGGGKPNPDDGPGEGSGSQGSGSAGSNNSQAGGTNTSGRLVSPKTGDTSAVMLWLMAAMCAAGMCALVIVRRRRA